MKKFILLLCVSALTTLATAAAKPTLQDDMEENLKDDASVILVRNDTFRPVQVTQEQTGKHLLCLASDFKKFFLYKVVKETFRGGQATALVRCHDGRLHISGGYI
jgi:hypothetical protein